MTMTLIVIILMVVGLTLLAIEFLVIPGFGVIGGLGGLAVLGSGYLAVTQLPSAYAGITIAAGAATAGVMFWLFPRSRTARTMVLETRLEGGSADPTLVDLLGREGVALTPLRPSGSAEFDDNPVDVVSDGQYVETGTRVKVVQVEGNRVVVEPVS